MACRSASNKRFWAHSVTVLIVALTPLAALAQSGLPPASEPVESSTVAAPDAIESGLLAPLTPQDDGLAATATAPSGAAKPATTAPVVPQASFGPGVWHGAAAAEVAALMAKTEVPLRSATLAGLWRRLMLTEETPQGTDPAQFLALRLDGLYRAGLLKDAAQLLATLPKTVDPVEQVGAARVLLALGDDDKACARVRTLPISGGPLKGRARNDALLMVAFCAARDKQPNHASLAAEVLRDQNFAEPLALAVLDSIAESKTPKLPRADNLRVIDYKFLSVLGKVSVERIMPLMPRATPDLMVAIARDAAAEPVARLIAAEAAARVNAYDDTDLAAAYRAVVFQPQQLANPPLVADAPGPASAATDTASRRALLFQAAEKEPAPARKAELIRALLDAARREAILLPVARIVAGLADAMRPTPDLAGFTEPAIETLLAAGQYDHAVGWMLSPGMAGPAGNPLLHWLTLVDIADAGEHVPHGSSMKYAEDLAIAGALSPVMIQRLATVLDALHYQVPIPIWEGAQNAAKNASKADQGHLPDTGLLPKLATAATQKQTGMTVLLTLAAMGPGAATGAHTVSLGESIKALAGAGLEADARRLGFEAVFEAWPRRPGTLANDSVVR
jgi:hypothetical protein